MLIRTWISICNSRRGKQAPTGSRWNTSGRPRRRRNWVLPSVLIVALLAVLGYVGWIALGQLGGGFGSFAGIAAPAPTETATVDAAAVAAAASPTPAPATPTAAPTATTAPVATATPTLEPTPDIAMGELISGTVNAVQGVNARREPNGEIIRTLNEGEGVVVTRQDGDWLQVILSDGTSVAWVSSEFVNRTPQMVPLEQLAANLHRRWSASAYAGSSTGSSTVGGNGGDDDVGIDRCHSPAIGRCRFDANSPHGGFGAAVNA